MPRVRLQPGETSIDTVSIMEPDADGVRTMMWSIRLPSGKLERHKTSGKCTKGELRRRARLKAEELLRSSGSTGAWKPSSSMSEYVRQVVIPGVEATPDERLRPSTRDRYAHVLALYAAAAEGYAIADATRPRTIEAALASIARANGTSTANQTKKVVSRYVMAALVREEVIGHNPLRDMDVTLPQHKAKREPQGGTALTPDEHAACMAWLLAEDPAGIVANGGHGRARAKDRIAARSEAIDLTLLQAVTGLRVGEALSLTAGDVQDASTQDCPQMALTVRSDVSKTHRGRTIPLVDKNVSERLLGRLTGKSGSDLVFCAPAAPGKPWDRSNVQKAVRRLYDDMADATGIGTLHDVSSHVWRATLNTLWMNRGVPEPVRAAYLGHSSEVNREFYTSLTDIGPLTQLLREGV